MMQQLTIKSAGAARGLIGMVSDAFCAHRRITLLADFAAVGTTFERVSEAMREQRHCDLTVLTPALLLRLQQAFPLRVLSAGSLGSTMTCFACRGDVRAFDISTIETLRRTLSEVDAIYTGDIRQSTVGRHLVHMLETLGLTGDLRPNVVEFPGGAPAVAALGDAKDKRVLAFAQRTEVLQNSGAVLAGPLPHAFRLATEYVLAVIDHAQAAQDFAAFLTAESLANTRRESGFDPV
ncbi:UNVERIFIED_ORG: molybdate transport system substrate-binding protein [Paraburkholderia sediminicola]|nr:molybdate transport system substrate-binding protein [Paraburkholderia sediminicola]